MHQSSSLSRTSGRTLLSILVLVCAVASLQAQSSNDVKEAQRLARVAQVARQQGRLEDAIRAYQTIAIVAKTSPAIAANAYLNAGNIYMALGKYEESAAAFRHSLSLDASSAEAQNNLVEALGELMQFLRSL